MKRVALIEFHFDFFIPLVDKLYDHDLEVILWTSHIKTLQKLQDGIIKYPSRLAQAGCTIDGQKTTGTPDQKIVQALQKKRRMILDQSRRFELFDNWQDERLWAHVLSIANYWHTLLKENNIDLILYKTEPHMFFDIILYHVAKQIGIDNIFFERLPFDKRIIICSDLEDMRGEVLSRMRNIGYNIKLAEASNKPDSKIELPFHFAYKSKHFKSKPGLLNKMVNSENEKTYGSIKQRISRLFRNRLYVYREDKKLWDALRQTNNPLKKSWIYYLGNRFKRNLFYQVYYKNLLKLLNYSLFRNKFQKGGILFCLQCQPERSSNPCGGEIYHDQITLLKDICEIVGPNVSVFVKEHPSQFSAYQYPEKGRSISFYMRLRKIKNAIPIPAFPTAEQLINDAKCVVSLGGSAAWAAINNGVPAIVCGQTGYAACDSVFPGRNRDELTESLRNILDQFQDKNIIIENVANYKERCKTISKQCYLDNIYRQRFEAEYDNAKMLSDLVSDYVNEKYADQQSMRTINTIRSE